jgi:hypothetical protein
LSSNPYLKPAVRIPGRDSQVCDSNAIAKSTSLSSGTDSQSKGLNFFKIIASTVNFTLEQAMETQRGAEI